VVKMSEEHLRAHLQLGELNQRASAAASALLQKTTGAQAPDLRHIALARRLLVTIALAVLGLVIGTVLLVSFVASGALPWIVGVFLVVAAVTVVVLGLHAGGHGWFVPLPVLALAGAWALAVSAGSWAAAASWALAALAFASAVIGAVLVIPAIAYRHAPAAPVGTQALVGAGGTTLSALAPTGVVRVNNETWTAQSLSGPLPAGAPVHVVKAEGLRLLVWSEAGDIPGPDTLGPANEEERKEEQ
jgi:membrane-bound ClpP family serine protease